MSDVRTKLLRISERWNTIERRAKEAEQFRQEAVVAAINEMRYAGRRFADVIAELHGNGYADSQTISDHLAVAESYLQNAEHDITDGVCYFAHRRIRKTIEKHGFSRVFKLCPKLEALYPEILKAEDVVKLSRETRHERKERYELLANEYLPKLYDAFSELRSKPKLAVGDDLPQRLRLLDRHVVTVAWISLVGSIASIIGIGLALWALVLVYKPPETQSVPETHLERSELQSSDDSPAADSGD